MNSEKEFKNAYDLRSGITIYTSQDQAIDTIITSLVTKVPAKFVLVTAVTGQVISAAGDRGKTDLVSLGSLIAGDLAASQEIARLTGVYQEAQMVLREGEKTHSFIAEAGVHLILFVQVTDDVPLGWARIVIREAAKKLEDVLNTHPENMETLDLGAVGVDLPDLFSDALDELWSQ